MPLLSVIVPAHNNGAKVVALVQSLAAWKQTKEILVVENGSTDGTEKTVREILLPEVTLIHQVTYRGNGDALRTGIAHAKGEIIMIPGEGFPLHPEWYTRLLDPFLHNGTGLVQGCRTASRGFWNLLRRDPGECGCILLRREILTQLPPPAPRSDAAAHFIDAAMKKRLHIVRIQTAGGKGDA